MRIFTNALTLLMFGIMVSCQQAAPETVETGEQPDSLVYSFSTITKKIPCKPDSEELCLDVSIEKIKLESGSSDDARQKMEEALLQAISETSNSEEPVKRPEQIAENLEKEYQQIVKEMPDYNLPWEYQSDFSVYLNEQGLFGVKLSSYSFTGGAHGNSFIYYYNFDVDNGKLLKLRDLILTKKYDQFIAQSETQFRDTRGIDSTESYEEAGFWFEDDQFTLNDNFRYSREGLEIVYNPYEIAPFSEGEIVLRFSYKAVEEFVKGEYRLRERSEEVNTAL